MYFRWTLFNGCTLLVAAITAALIAARLRRVLQSNWPLLYYAAVLGYWKGFEGSLNTAWVFLGGACGLLLRFEFIGGAPLTSVRILEFLFFGYVILRCVELLLLWPW